MQIIIVLIFLALFIIAGIPAAFGLGFTSVVHLIFERGITNIPYWLIAQRMLYGIDSFPLLAVPLFILVGRVMNESGTTTRVFRFANALVGHFRAGLAHVNILTSMLFAGMSGSATADAAGLGSIEIKAMVDQGYDPDFSAGITAASACIGPVIPPSIPAVFYALLANVSVTAVLIAGFIPGVLMGLAMMVQVAIIARRRSFPISPRAKANEVWEAFRGALLPLLTPVILIGGILTGVFTATESAAVAALYAVILSLGYRSMSLAKLADILRKSAMDSAVLMFILSTSSVYGWLITKAQVPALIAKALLDMTTNYYAVYLLIIGLLLFLGMFISSIVSLNILTPILVPMIISVGGDPLQFGVIMILTLMIGEITPPFGMVLFAVVRIWDVSFERLVRNALPFAASIMAVILLLLLFPQVATFLPALTTR